MQVRDARPSDAWVVVRWIPVLFALVALAVFLAVRTRFGVVSLLLILPGVWLLLHSMSRAWAYRCPHCGELFQLSIPGQFTAVNWGDERSVRCPSCGTRSLVKALRRID